MSYHIGIDVGGTFTDCVAVSSTGAITHAKALSSRGDPTEGIMHGLGNLAAELEFDVGQLLAQSERFCHGTTIGTNLVVERKGARVGLITTRGHRDVILMMRGTGGAAGKSVDDIYRVHDFRPPQPIVPRSAILELDERTDRNGSVVVALDESSARAKIAAWLGEHDFEAVAICLLWSFRYPAHEQAVGAIVRDIEPALFTSVSSDVAPRLGEYERTVATVINAYVGPRSSSYLTRLDERLRSDGLEKPLLVMQSNGGVVPSALARARPFTVIDSGPTGGLAGAAALAHVAGHEHVIATDMGGTSFDVGLVIRGEPLVADERVIGQYTYQLPHLDVRSIACGGGSIASVNELTRSLEVGPESAGSVPGPACYGRGGLLPTVTDADVVLGLLRPAAFLDGRMQLDLEASRRAISPVARKLGLSIEETAAGIVSINNKNAALLIRQRTVEQGLDPRDFVVYAFGGAGPVHAFGFAADLGGRRVVVPLGNGASTFSAYGIASADSVRYVEADMVMRAPFDSDELRKAVARVENDARAALEAEGFAVQSVERILLMRYLGQFLQSMAVSLGEGTIDANSAERVVADFERDYERLYGEGARVVFQTIEAFAVRLRIVGERGIRTAAKAAPRDRAGSPRQADTHEVYWPSQQERLPTAVVAGRHFALGDVVEGPALIELPHTTIAVAPNQRAERDVLGNVALSV